MVKFVRFQVNLPSSDPSVNIHSVEGLFGLIWCSVLKLGDMAYANATVAMVS